MLLPYPGSGHICRHLDLNSAKLHANALMYNYLDYCNSLLSGISKTDLTRLQRVQNRLACVVTKSPPFTCSFPLLHYFNLLPVKFRVDFKISLLICMTHYEKQPACLHSLLATSLRSRSLKSNKGITLLVPRVRNNTGARDFYSCSLQFWTTFRYLSLLPPQLPSSGSISKHTSFTWPFP